MKFLEYMYINQVISIWKPLHLWKYMNMHSNILCQYRKIFVTNSITITYSLLLYFALPEPLYIMYQKEILQLRRNGVEIVSVKNGIEDIQM